MLKDLSTILYAPEGTGGGTVETLPEEPIAPVKPSKDETPPAAVTPEKDGATETPEEVKLSQDALSKRISRAKSTGSKEAMDALGFDSVEQAQAAFKAGQDAIKAQMTEKERQEAELLELSKQSATEKEAREKAEDRALQAELKAAALGLMGIFANPAQAFRLLDLKDVKQMDDGSFEGIEVAIETLAKTEPWTLATEPKRKKGDPIIGSTDPVEDDLEGSKKESEASKRARYFGGGASESPFFESGEGKVKVT